MEHSSALFDKDSALFDKDEAKHQRADTQLLLTATIFHTGDGGRS
jgi:hypothetical protein